MTGKEIAVTIAVAVLGGGGLVGLAFYFLRRYLDKKLTAAESEAAKRKSNQIKRMQIEDELHHAYGRLLFWIYRFVITGDHNGDLDKAFKALEAAEEKKKNLDREIIAESGQE